MGVKVMNTISVNFAGFSVLVMVGVRGLAGTRVEVSVGVEEGRAGEASGARKEPPPVVSPPAAAAGAPTVLNTCRKVANRQPLASRTAKRIRISLEMMLARLDELAITWIFP